MALATSYTRYIAFTAHSGDTAFHCR